MNFPNIPDGGNYQFAPKGECKLCDDMREREVTFFPPHNALLTCRSGRRNHCTCDSCF